MKIQFSNKLIAKKPEIYAQTQEAMCYKIITYILNSNLRKAIKLQDWIKDQVDLPKQNVIKYSKNIATGNNYDETIINILRYISSNINYKRDSDQWKMTEYWQDASTTIDLGTGDCEDGAILMYIIARIKGIPENRLYLIAGDVKDLGDKTKIIGHCYLAYKPNNYPLNFQFLDWCYNRDLSDVKQRSFFTINKDKITEEKDIHIVDSDYSDIWFIFNESFSSDRVTYDFTRITG